MFPACVMIASTAIFAGISGATLLLPLFFLAFPALGVPALVPTQAVGAALVLQISAFGLAVVRYTRRHLVRWPLVAEVGAVSVPTAVVGALVARAVPVDAFRVVFAAGLVGVTPMLLRRGPREMPASAPRRLGVGEIVLAGGVGGLFTGVVSAGVGEATIPVLSRRALALPTVAATATALIAFTVGAATATTALRLAVDHQLTQYPWRVVAWGAPGAVLGEELAVRVQGRIPERPVRVGLGVLFAGIAVAFVALALR
jgi:uncharacterized membrane protein YfcA